MKTPLLQLSRTALLLVSLVLVAGCNAEASSSAANNSPTAADLLTLRPAPDVPQLPPTNVAPEIAANPVAPATLPANFNPSPNLKEVIKLAQAGVDGSVVLSFVTNANGAFGLGSDEIIYLNDLGVANDVILAMMQRDHAAGVVAQTAAQSVPVTPAVDPNAYVPANPATPVVVQTPAPTVIVEPPPVTVEYIQDNLSPYGSWVEVEGYGRCWQPIVVVQQPNWQPYCDRGRWIYSDCGWYWASDYSWGNIAFHYGRWFRNARFGWCWSPDTVWGPSWVSWRHSNEYYGWAPLPPAARFRPGFGFSYYDRNVSVSFDFGISADCYTFVPSRHFYDARPGRFALPRREVTQVFHNTTVINNIVVGRNNTIINRGFAPATITAATHNQIHTVPVHDLRGSSAQPGFSGRREWNAPAVIHGRDRSSQNFPTQPAGANPTTIMPPAAQPSANRDDQGNRWNHSPAQPPTPANNPTFDRIRGRNPQSVPGAPFGRQQPSPTAPVVTPPVSTPVIVTPPTMPGAIPNISQTPVNRDDQRPHWNNPQPQLPANNPAFDRNGRVNFQPNVPAQRRTPFDETARRQPIVPQSAPVVQPAPVRPQPVTPQFVPPAPAPVYVAPVRPQFQPPQLPVMPGPQRVQAAPPAAYVPPVSSPYVNPRAQQVQRGDDSNRSNRNQRDSRYGN